MPGQESHSLNSMLRSIGGVLQCPKFAFGCKSRRGRHNRGQLSYEMLGQVDDKIRMRDVDARRLSGHEGVEVARKRGAGYRALCKVDEVIEARTRWIRNRLRSTWETIS